VYGDVKWGTEFRLASFLGGLCEPGAGMETVGEVCEDISGDEVMLWEAAVFIFTFPEIEILFVVIEGAMEFEKDSVVFAVLTFVGVVIPKLGLA
jgi:hypothetical protein